MDDPVGAAGDCKGVRTDRREVFAERRFTVGEYRLYLRCYCLNFSRKCGDQVVDKRSRIYSVRFSDFPINVFGNLLDCEEDRNDHLVGDVNFVGCDFKPVRAVQGAARKRRTLGGPTDLVEPAALQTSIERRAAQLRHETLESHMQVIEREAGAPAIDANDRLVVTCESCLGRDFSGPFARRT